MSELEELVSRCTASVRAEGLNCPLPLLKTKKALAPLRCGESVHLRATDPGSMQDLLAYAAEAGHRVLWAKESDGLFEFVFEKGGAARAD